MKPNLTEILTQQERTQSIAPFRKIGIARAHYASELATAKSVSRIRRSVRAAPQNRIPEPDKRTLLLISNDARLHQKLRCVANLAGRIVVRVDGATDMARILYAVRPAAVLVDLDLSKAVAWEKADALLQQKSCPPVVLLMAPSEQFDVRTAIRAGCILDKSAEPTRLLEVVEEILAAPNLAHAEQNAIQRVVIRWLRPRNWSPAQSPPYRFWGINE